MVGRRLNEAAVALQNLRLSWFRRCEALLGGQALQTLRWPPRASPHAVRVKAHELRNKGKTELLAQVRGARPT